MLKVNNRVAMLQLKAVIINNVFAFGAIIRIIMKKDYLIFQVPSDFCVKKMQTRMTSSITANLKIMDAL